MGATDEARGGRGSAVAREAASRVEGGFDIVRIGRLVFGGFRASLAPFGGFACRSSG